MKPLTLNFDNNGCIEPAMLHLVDCNEFLESYIEHFPNSTQREILSNN